MKKVISLILAVMILLLCLASCTKIVSPDTTGAQIDIYMGTKVINLDPATAYTDENAVKIINLIFEGLMQIDERGNVKNALASSYSIYEDKKTGETVMRIKLKNTYWSDGSLVQANDLVYAWKRILEPEFATEAASLLFAIKGAKQAKTGEVGIDDIGLCSISKDVLEIRFEDGVDTNEFLYNLASPALVPLRENKISQYQDTWSRSNTDLSTNGPFRVRKFSSNETEYLLLERSKFYYRNWSLSTEELDKYVYPYRLYIHYGNPLTTDVYSRSDATVLSDAFANRQVFYVSNLTKEAIEYFKTGGKQTTNKLSSTFSVYFNTTKAPFDNPTIRYALSLALDRDAIAEAVGCGSSAATGLLPTMIFDTKKGTSFRKQSGQLISTSSGLEEAKQMLEEAGINPYRYADIYLYYRADNVNDSYYSAQNGFKSKEKTVCEFVQKAWNELGFNVVLKACTASEYESAYTSKEFDCIALDYQCLSAYPIYDLAPFAIEYSGKVTLNDTGSQKTYVSSPHITGYASLEYNDLIKQAFEATNQKEKATILHNAEKMLIVDAPIVPIIFNGETYAVSKVLSGLTTNYWGSKLFTKVEMKDYLSYLETANFN